MKKVAALLALALAAAALVACGDDNGDNGTVPVEPETNGEATQENGATGTIKFVADPDGQLAYTEDEVTAQAGKSTIELDNPSSVPHDVVIEDENGDTVGQTDVITSDTDSAEIDLEPGTYTFYCSVPGHREGGMEGTLTVE